MVVFKKGERWYYDGSLSEVVNCFTYVGLAFNMQLSYQRMCSDLAKKGKRVLVFLISSLHDYGQMPKHVFFKLFDTKVLPIWCMAQRFGVLKDITFWSRSGIMLARGICVLV